MNPRQKFVDMIDTSLVQFMFLCSGGSLNTSKDNRDYASNINAAAAAAAAAAVVVVVVVVVVSDAATATAADASN